MSLSPSKPRQHRVRRPEGISTSAQGEVREASIMRWSCSTRRGPRRPSARPGQVGRSISLAEEAGACSRSGSTTWGQIGGGPARPSWWDKAAYRSSKAGREPTSATRLRAGGTRFVRRSAFIAATSCLMPLLRQSRRLCDEVTMIDTLVDGRLRAQTGQARAHLRRRRHRRRAQAGRKPNCVARGRCRARSHSSMRAPACKDLPRAASEPGPSRSRANDLRTGDCRGRAG